MSACVCIEGHCLFHYCLLPNAYSLYLQSNKLQNSVLVGAIYSTPIGTVMCWCSPTWHAHCILLQSSWSISWAIASITTH